jgi:hypothetical protein
VHGGPHDLGHDDPYEDGTSADTAARTARRTAPRPRWGIVDTVPAFPALRDAALSIRQVLRNSVTLSDDPALNGVEVDLRSPRQLELDGVTDVISLWTHRIDVQPDLRNRPPQRPTIDLELRRGIPVELLMHVTVLVDEAPAALLVTGRALQALDDHRRLSDPALVGVLAASNSELFVEFDTQTAYDTGLVWSSLQTHQRLGIGLRVRGVHLESDLPPVTTHRVLTRTGTVATIEGVA